MWKVVICDDEPEIVLSVIRMVDQVWTRPHTTQGLFSAEALEQYLTVEAPGETDILLMDIELGEENGIQRTRQILDRWPRIKVIFLTGHIEYCEEIFQTRPSGFLVKPLKPERLRFALDKAAGELEQGGDRYLVVADRDRHTVRIPLEQIRYLKSEGRLVQVQTEERLVESYRRLGELEPELPEQFIRCHQSYLVNLAYVSRLGTDGLHLVSGEKLPVSRSRAKETRERLMRFAGEKL